MLAFLLCSCLDKKGLLPFLFFCFVHVNKAPSVVFGGTMFFPQEKVDILKGQITCICDTLSGFESDKSDDIMKRCTEKTERSEKETRFHLSTSSGRVCHAIGKF